MEQVRTGLNPADSDTRDSILDNSALLDQKRLEKRQKSFIYTGAKNTGIDLMLATGGEQISEDQLNALFFRGYLDYPANEIINGSYFEGLGDFNEDVYASYLRKLHRHERRRAHWLKEISSNSIPEYLFRPIEFAGIEGRSVVKKGKKAERLVKDIGVIGHGEVDEETKLQRYLKYKLAKGLLKGVKDDVSESRLTGIAMGIFLDGAGVDGKKISSYQSEILKISGGLITQADVELSADSANMYDFIYPERRSDFLKELTEAARTPIIVPVDRAREIYPIIASEVYLETRKKQLLVGEVAVRAAVERGSRSDSIQKISTLLLDNAVVVKNIRKPTKEYSAWQQSDCIEYGKWLLGLLDASETDMTARRLINAYRLGLGPGTQTLGSKNFDSLDDFFKHIGAEKRKKGRFAHWEREDWLSWANKVRTENDGKFTKEIIKENSKLNPEDPTLRMANNFMAMAEFEAAAGRRPYNETMTFDQCMQMIGVFVRANGRLPRRREYSPKNSLPSLNSVYIRCGGMANVRRIINEELAAETDGMNLAA